MKVRIGGGGKPLVLTECRYKGIQVLQQSRTYLISSDVRDGSWDVMSLIVSQLDRRWFLDRSKTVISMKWGKGRKEGE